MRRVRASRCKAITPRTKITRRDAGDTTRPNFFITPGARRQRQVSRNSAAARYVICNIRAADRVTAVIIIYMASAAGTKGPANRLI